MSTRRQQLEALLAADPDDPFVLYGLSMEDEADGNTEDAVERLQQLLLRFPEYVPAYLQAGQLLLKLDRPRDAKDVLTMGMHTAFKVADHHAYSEMEALIQGIS